MNRGDQRFTKQQRLLHARDYQRLLRQAERRKARGQLQLLASRNNIAPARLGLIVPKRLVAKAHDRNRIKRIVREAFRRQARDLPPYDMVIRVRGRGDETTLKESLQWLLDWVKQ